MEILGTEAVFDLSNIMSQLLIGFLTKGLGSFIAFTYNLVTVTSMYQQAFTAQVTRPIRDLLPVSASQVTTRPVRE